MSASRDRTFTPRASSIGDAAMSLSRQDGTATQQRTEGLEKLRNQQPIRLRQSWRSKRCRKFKMVDFVGNCVASKLQPCERAHRADVVKHFFRAGIGEFVQLPQAINRTSRPTEKAAARHSDQPWDNGARSQLRARPKAPRPPSQPGTHHASCASSWPHSRAMQNSAGPSEHSPNQ